MAMAKKKPVAAREYRDLEKTTSIPADGVLELVRRSFIERNPNERVREVRWTLDGVAVDHVEAVAG